MTGQPQDREKPQRGSWIPWIFVGMFAVVIVANGVMVAVAFDSWTGLETESAYEDGLQYNRQIAAVQAQRDLGWKVDLAVAQSAGRRLDVAVTLEDADGNPFKADELRATFSRPTHEGYDLETWLPHSGAPGEHRAEVELPLAGIWDLSVEARSGGRSYRLDRRVEVAP
ncbi:MAG: FixH family protein [Rhodovibrionaceae bacterium]|nr:FixH family protein [Rhodovibrionaceae bacterium]